MHLVVATPGQDDGALAHLIPADVVVDTISTTASAGAALLLRPGGRYLTAGSPHGSAPLASTKPGSTDVS